jgi:hypothetical protein
VESSGIDKVSSGGNHGNAAVLELGSAEPEEGFITSPVGEVEGIKVGERSGGTTNVIKGKADLGCSPVTSASSLSPP